MASVQWSVERPLDSHAACATGTVILLDAARRAGVRRVVYAGSSAAYGDQPTASKRETDLPAPLSPYAAAKLAGEEYCRAFTATYGLETVVLRYFNVFGPRQDPESPYSAVIPLFITAMLGGAAAGRLRRRAAIARLQLRGQRGAGQPAGRRRPRRGRPRAERGQRPEHRSARAVGRAQPPAGHPGSAAARAAPPRRRPRKPGRHHPGPHAAWVTSRTSISTRACGARSTTTAAVAPRGRQDQNVKCSADR